MNTKPVQAALFFNKKAKTINKIKDDLEKLREYIDSDANYSSYPRDRV